MSHDDNGETKSKNTSSANSRPRRLPVLQRHLHSTSTDTEPSRPERTPAVQALSRPAAQIHRSGLMGYAASGT
ncbi:hypothetical protein KCP69_20555 [Salmonella enterica subsp. enterica]|nr:hypothetical protein KCP69_20555 [Salmonella enterica subsp. enterica]